LSAFLAELQRVAEDLNRLNVGWALVGALAYSVHAEPRTTRDIDVAMAVSSEEIDRIAEMLVGWGYGEKQLLMQSGPVRRLGVRVMVPSRLPYSIPLDLLSSSCGIEGEIVRGAITIELLPSLFVPVASLGHLLAMKLLSQDDFERVRDKADANALMMRAAPEDIECARRALQLMTERGFNRDKNLAAELSSCLSLAGKGGKERRS
jgi:hypothetical protein